MSCGDGVAEPPESCDGSDLAGETCATLATMYGGGALACAVDCTFDPSGCSVDPPGDGVHDFNGDGYADFVAGAPVHGASLTTGLSPGGAFIYFGGPGLVTGSAPVAIAPSLGENETAGWWVSAAGDVDADGFGDVLVSGLAMMPPFSGGPDVARLYLGGPGPTFDTGIDLTFMPTTTTTPSFRMRTAALGDVNGDGFADVAIGDPDLQTVWVHLGGAGGPDTVPDGVLDAPCEGGLGFAIAGAGDVNGDGFDDAIVGAPFEGGGGGCGPSGAVCIWFGGPGATFDDAVDGVLVRGCSAGNSAFGRSVASAGDVNADGYDDVLVAEPFAAVAQLFFGGPGTAFGPAVDAELAVAPGESVTVTFAGDLNGDLFDDVAVGASGYWDVFSTDPGWVYVYFGGPGAFDETPDGVLVGTTPRSRFGHGLASPGDVNNDQFPDLVVGAPGGPLAQLFVFFGGPGATFDTTADVVLDDMAPDFLGQSVD